eukprot:m.138448 g.138448  ORF g.138448 m.138448 type:complete len:145 (-) comp14011_c1_seq25:516-950(-)
MHLCFLTIPSDVLHATATITDAHNSHKHPPTLKSALLTFTLCLHQETEIEHDRESLLATFCYQLESLMRKPWKDVLDEYKSLNALHGLSVRVYHNQRLVDDERDFTAKVVGIADSGELLVKNEETGAVQTISGQEISIRPKTTA